MYSKYSLKLNQPLCSDHLHPAPARFSFGSRNSANYKEVWVPHWQVSLCARAYTWLYWRRGQHTDRHFPLLSVPISVWQVNGEHKTYLKATFTTWLIPLHCVISRCHISPPHVCLNAFPSTLWLVSLGWLPQIHSSRAPRLCTSSLKGKTPYCTFYLGVQQVAT